jgi:hypothetical protein
MRTKPALQKILKRILYAKKEERCAHSEVFSKDLTRRIDKQIRIRKESNTTNFSKPTNLQDD